MSPIRNLDDLSDMARRRVRLLIRVSVLGCVFSLLLAMSQKYQFQSTEVLQFDGPAVAGKTDTQLRLIRQRLMTRTNLIEVIDAYNIYAEYPEMKPDEMVARLRQSVRFEGGDIDANTMTPLFVTAQMHIAMQARQVAHELSQRIITLQQTDGDQVGTLRVIEPAAFPDRPLANNRKQIALIGAVLSVLTAFGLAYVMELRQPVVRSARQMQRETGIGPVASIPFMDTAPQEPTRWQRFLNWLDGPGTSDDLA